MSTSTRADWRALNSFNTPAVSRRLGREAVHELSPAPKVGLPLDWLSHKPTPLWKTRYFESGFVFIETDRATVLDPCCKEAAAKAVVRLAADLADELELAVTDDVRSHVRFECGILSCVEHLPGLCRFLLGRTCCSYVFHQLAKMLSS